MSEIKKHFFRITFLIVLITVGMFLFARISIVLHDTPNQPIRYGISFSTAYAGYLGLDPIATYHDLVETLGVRAVRIPVYWSDVQKTKDQYDWNQLDTLVKYSEAQNVKLTLAIGHKVPRWPECYVPGFALHDSREEQQRLLGEFLQSVVTRYKSSSALERWQVENEPFLPFGVCDRLHADAVKQEIDLVRALDSTHPIQITASGEMEPWKIPASLGDIFGISVYRTTWNRVFGYFTFPFSPWVYRARLLSINLSHKPVVISELQAEPWFFEEVKSHEPAYWYDFFRVEDFNANIDFARKIQVSEVYLWGAEWWAFLRAHGDTRLWDVARPLFERGLLN